MEADGVVRTMSFLQFLEIVRACPGTFPQAVAGHLFAAAVSRASMSGVALRPGMVALDPQQGMLLDLAHESAATVADAGYVAPEALNGGAPADDPRVLVYAAGAFGYHLLTLEPPPPAPVRAHPYLTGPIGEVVRIALAPDWRDRFASLEHMKEALQAVQPAPAPEIERRLLAAVLAVCAGWGSEDTPAAQLRAAAERVENGGANPTVTEVTPDGTKVTELAFDLGVVSYRAFRYEWPPVLRVRADIVPKVLNARNPGPDVTVTIEPEEFDPALIDVASIRLAEAVPAERVPDDPPDGRGGPRAFLRVRFPTEGLAPLLTPGLNRVPIGGSLVTGALFRGEVELRVLESERRTTSRPDPRLVSALGTLPARIRIDAAGSRTPVVGVYDVHGRAVVRWRALADPTGTFTWNGRGSDGAPVRSGLYFLRLEGTTARRGIKILVVR